MEKKKKSKGKKAATTTAANYNWVMVSNTDNKVRIQKEIRCQQMKKKIQQSSQVETKVDLIPW